MGAKETLGQMIRRLRAVAGLTQKQVAEAAAVDLAALRNWENDRREPGWRSMLGLAAALGANARDFLATTPVDRKKPRQPLPAGPTKRPPPKPRRPRGPQREAGEGTT